MKKILVTGGAGYIGSHTVKKLVENNYDVLVVDDLSTGRREAVKSIPLEVADIGDKEAVARILREYRPDAVIHFAASKEANESVVDPKKYYFNNTAKSIIFLNCLLEAGVNNFIFSSTAAVYGDVQEYPITEEFPVNPVNPYGSSKAMIEKIILDYEKSYGICPIILRYFNAGGADIKGALGNQYPDAKDVVSVVMKAASGKLPRFELFGTDYNTPDGTCIRDIIHVDDLAEAHVRSLESMLRSGTRGIFNLGSEKGYSVKEIVDTAKKVTGVDFKVAEGERRKGDLVVSIASSEKAKRELSWSPKLGLEEILKTAWEWESTHPEGHKKQ